MDDVGIANLVTSVIAIDSLAKIMIIRFLRIVDLESCFVMNDFVVVDNNDDITLNVRRRR